ncbi:MAG: DivIVA domain-containing protein [Bdellovibrionales bacterium]
MKIAPIDIAHKSFKKKTFGFDTEEVMDFLRAIADEYEDVIRDRNNLKEQMRDKELSILEYKERDKTLRDTITTAQRMSVKVREDAEKEAKLILNDANQKADLIVKDARDSLKAVYQEITDIKRAKIQFESHMKALIQTHLKIMEQGNDLTPNFDLSSSKKTTNTKDNSVKVTTPVSPVSM